MAILLTRASHFAVDGVDYACQTAATSISSELLVRAWQNGRVRESYAYALEIVAGQDLAEGSLWDLMVEHTGQEVYVVLKPYGNADRPTEREPWIQTTATVSLPDGTTLLGGAPALAMTERRTFTTVWSCAEPKRISQPSLVGLS